MSRAWLYCRVAPPDAGNLLEQHGVSLICTDDARLENTSYLGQATEYIDFASSLMSAVKNAKPGGNV